ncbi:MAG: TNT domain-containing protein, partial [Micromonosporaceae bacterium]
PETDLAAGLRFEPHDHPESDRFDTAEGLAVTGAGGLPADHPAVAALLDGYDPIADMHERDWDRRYVVTYDRATPEFAWPPGEVYPEGGCSDGEPVMLAVGTEIDRFGDEHGRVFAADGTSFRRRSLPPPRLDAGYHRYRVLRELPMWRAVSASWFGQPGGGDRYRAVYPVNDLLAMGYLAEITGEQKPDNNEAGGEA